GAANALVNQKSNGGSWQPLGTFDFVPNKGQGVVLTDKGDGVVVADAIRFVGPQDGSGSAPPQTAATTPPPAPQPAPPATAAPPAPAPSASPPAPAQPAAANDPRSFCQTGYRIAEDAFWNYFQFRGGVRSFGYPVSNAFFLYGTKVQVFQRQIMQLRPDGGV